MNTINKANEIAVKILNNYEIMNPVKEKIKSGVSILDIPNWNDAFCAESENEIYRPLWKDLWIKAFDNFPEDEDIQSFKKIFWKYYLYF